MTGFIINFTHPLLCQVIWQDTRIVQANDTKYVDEYETLTGYGNLGYGVSYGG